MHSVLSLVAVCCSQLVVMSISMRCSIRGERVVVSGWVWKKTDRGEARVKWREGQMRRQGQPTRNVHTHNQARYGMNREWHVRLQRPMTAMKTHFASGWDSEEPDD